MTNALTRGISFRFLAALMIAGWFVPAPARGQVFVMTREQLIKYTAKSPYERFPDGRPKVPDALLEKFKDMSSEEIGLSRSGFPNQFVDGLQVLHPDKKRRFRLFSGCRGEIQAAAVEVDRVDEVPLVAEAAGRVLHPLDLGIPAFEWL